MFVYEATITKTDEGYHFEFEDIGAAYGDGETYKEAIEEAAATLQLVIATYLDSGMRLPEPVFRLPNKDETRVAVAIDVTQEFIEQTKCMTITDAAQDLGVSKGRIVQMINAGILQAVAFGNERLVTIASLNKRKANPRGAGRPKKEVIQVVSN